MALFQRLAGARAVFYVVPLLGGLCVWMTSVLGTSVHGRLTGTLAAILVATSPSFLVELMAPASDVAATALWTSTLALALRNSPAAAFAPGKGGEKLGNPHAKIDWQAENRAQLNHNGVHLPVTAGQAQMQ